MGLEMDYVWLIFGAVLGFYVFVFGFLRKVNELWSLVKLGRKVYGALPPGDMGWPFLGSTLSFYRAFTVGGDPDSFINHFVSRYGRIGMYKTHLYGVPTVIATDPEICRRIYSDDERFIPSYPPSVKLLGTADDSVAKKNHRDVYRLTAAPINGSEALSHYIDDMEQIVTNSLEELSSMKEPTEFLSEMKALTFKIISRVFIGSLAEPRMAELQRWYTQLAAGVLSIFPFNLPGFAYHRAINARKEIAKILKCVIEEKRRAAENNEEREKKSQMDVVMEARDENGEKLLDDNAIIDMLLGLLYAGHHTTAHAAMWALIHITDSPQIFQKAKEEQELIIKERPPTQKGMSFKEYREMKYLAKIINEMLRKTTIAFVNFRQAMTDVNINGYVIPRGWKIPIWIRAVHMDPQIYLNPQEFDPSRWDNYTPKPGTFIPFGYGSRLCPGSELARLEITILLHHFLLNNYKFERVNPKCNLTHLSSPKPIDNCLSKIVKVDESRRVINEEKST